MRRIALLLPLLLVSLACARGGRTVPRQDNAGLLERRGIEEPALAVAAQEIDNGDGRDAFERLVAHLRQPGARRHAHRDAALYLAGNALISDRQRLKAFFYFDELLDTYPQSGLFLPAAERQYQIADSVLSGDRDRVLFVPEADTGDALEMLFRVQLRVPGSELAERALLRSGEHYFDSGDHDFAEDVYTIFLDRFPRSPRVPYARLRQAWSNLLQYEGPRYDPTPLLDARQQFRAFADAYPDLADRQGLDEVFAYVDEQLDDKRRIKADFYRRTGEPEAAALLDAKAEDPEEPEEEA